MADRYQYDPIPSSGYNGRVGPTDGGIVGILVAPLIGMVLIWLACTQAFQTERHAVNVEKALTLGSRIVQALDDKNAAKLQDKLTYVTGEAVAHGPVSDPATGVTVPALRLVRNVQMYQWQENRESTGRHSYRYTYYKTWSDRQISSSSFHYGGYYNPQFPILKQDFNADCTVDGHKVPSDLMHKVPAAVPLAPIPMSLDLYKLTSLMHAQCHRTNGEVYVGPSPSSPNIGDVRISYMVTPMGALSLVAAEHGTTFTPYVVSDGDEAVYLIEFGKVPVPKMFKDAQDENQLHLWGMRFVWWMLNWLGMILLFYPIKAFTDMLPFVGEFAGAIVIGLCAGAAFMVNGIIIVASWFIFRPVFSAVFFGVLLLVGWSLMSTMSPREERIR